jgi:hypothetical protein
MNARCNLGFTPSRENAASQVHHYSERTISRMTTCAHTAMRKDTNDHV